MTVWEGLGFGAGAVGAQSVEAGQRGLDGFGDLGGLLG